MANEYGTVALLRAQLKLNPGDATRDAELAAALAAASRRIDQRCGRRFYKTPEPTARTWPLVGRITRDIDGEVLLVDDIATADGLLVETGSAGGTTWAPVTNYETLPYNAADWGLPVTALRQFYHGWSWSWNVRARVRVTAVWGWPTVPDEITQAAVLLAARLYKRQDSPDGVAGSADWGIIRVSRLDPDVEDLIGPYMVPGFA